MASPGHGAFHPSSASCVIHQNDESDIILLDIPRSIAAAQGRSDTLLSTAPLDKPIEPNEDYRARTQKPQGTAPPQDTTNALHVEYKATIEHALSHIHTHVSGPWCAPRKLLTQAPACGKDQMDIDDPEKDLESRLREWATWDQSKGGDIAFDLQLMMASLGATPESGPTATHSVSQQKWQMSYHTAQETPNGAHMTGSDLEDEMTEPWAPTFHNPGDVPLELSVSNKSSAHVRASHQETNEYRFKIPARSTFFLSDSTHSDDFRTSFRQLTDEYNLPRHFDLVLLDPPWPNRSAKRKGAYEQVGGMPFLKKMLLKMDVDTYLEHNALVGIWITNKASLRKHVLGRGGLFETWNVGLVEEWVWIKTTSKGEPMFDIDSGMRRPYEVLLLGRAAPNSWTRMAHKDIVRRRVIAAVPDVHSRKPCLKRLFESFGLLPQDYSALEIFSRYLVQGWTAWGNEVIKFNWDWYWTPS
ncbi:MT-A70-domain-containing protein [Plenodomus tracheiphilus IPT5]|uniref:MT-A70-domain-containing protein n=1 Tax=Plenodomus tracheiphilus IPT5 TaxID=1408161 RepID=A0A6A7BKB1_9PLEO|nr:MT-A70-domain-containing protein [Plenodomus tracheiphilus IPT5]